MKKISWQKIIGKGYNKLFNISVRYILLKGARNTKKSVVGIVYHALISIFSDDRNNCLVLRQVAKSHRTTTFKTFLRIINQVAKIADGIFLFPLVLTGSGKSAIIILIN